MAKPFRGAINIDIRDSQRDWEPFDPPMAPDGAPEDLESATEDMLVRE